MNLYGSFLLVLSVVASCAFALDCYTCSSDTNPECENPKKNSDKVKAQTCTPRVLAQQSGNWLKDLTKLDFFQAPNQPAMDIPMQCQKIVATQGDKRQVYRSCQLDSGGTDPCTIYQDKSADEGIKIEHCSTCKEDLCNAASPVGARNGFVAALVVFLGVVTRNAVVVV